MVLWRLRWDFMHQDDGVYNMSHTCQHWTHSLRASCRPRWTIRPMQDPLHFPPHPSPTQYPAVLTPSPLFKEQTSISAQAVSDDLITLACPLRIQLLLTVHQQFTIFSLNSAACETALGDCLTEPNNKTWCYSSLGCLLLILLWVAHFKKMQTVWSEFIKHLQLLHFCMWYFRTKTCVISQAPKIQLTQELNVLYTGLYAYISF